MITIDPSEILSGIETVLVIDWPGKDVPDALVRAGFRVVVRGGPGPEDYFAWELLNDEIVKHRTGRVPEHANLIYSYRPFSELPEIIATARRTGAKTIWTQSGLAGAGEKDPRGCWLPEEELRSARDLVEAAGLTLVTEPYIGDVARGIQKPR